MRERSDADDDDANTQNSMRRKLNSQSETFPVSEELECAPASFEQFFPTCIKLRVCRLTLARVRVPPIVSTLINFIPVNCRIVDFITFLVPSFALPLSLIMWFYLIKNTEQRELNIFHFISVVYCNLWFFKSSFRHNFQCIKASW